MAWPAHPHLSDPADLTPAGLREVELALLDGQRVFAAMAATDDPAEAEVLKLIWLGRPVEFPVSQVRSLRRRSPLRPAAAAAAPRSPAAPDGPVDADVLLAVQVVFTDGGVLDGDTLGWVNRKAGGVYLYLRLEADRFQAIWLPRPGLRSIHLQRHAPAGAPAGVPPAPATTLPALLASMQTLARQSAVSLPEALFELGLVDAVALYAMQQGTSAHLRSQIDARLAGEWPAGALDHARARAVRTAEVDAETFEIDPSVLARLPWGQAARLHVLPLGLAEGRLVAASASPLNPDLAAQLGMLAGGPVVLVWAARDALERRLSGPPPGLAPATAADPAGAELQLLLDSARQEIGAHGTFVHSYAVDERSSIVQLVKRIITDAHAQKASDIHIETDPAEGLSRVRLRKDGELEEYLRVPADLRAALVSRLKVMSKLDISERRRPQDGKINFADFSALKLELRVAILPTHDGLEDVVLRLLASSKPTPLAQLGLSARDEEIVNRLAQRPYGLILACGPTGSGKTTTLHSLLAEINTESRKIWTAEDPIEITQPGLRQLQVNPKIGLSFAQAMRAFLRADPDVIMIGEVRDEETARIAIEASLTGHLVLSTLHTNNAAESVVRLLDLGMDPMNFGDSLIAIIAQRLVRALCRDCRRAVPLPPERFGVLVQQYVDGTGLTREQGQARLLEAGGWTSVAEACVHEAVGCPHCHGKGHKGRMGIYEVLQGTPEIKHSIQARASSGTIFDQAVAGGMRSLRQDALEKVCAGAIDLKQAAGIYS
jgi:type II secretory ATPase GspE/PulE/Tfp pilus assembly ATPase PilB-like protein